MWDFSNLWLLIVVCVGVPGLVWLKYRGQSARRLDAQYDLAREMAERAYAEEQARGISDLLAERLSEKATISAGRSKFEAVYDPIKDAVWVSNLGASPYLPSKVFYVASELIGRNGRAPKGDAIGSLLSEPGLPLDSIEGAVASQVFGRNAGDPVYRRITPICALMVYLRLAEDDGGSGYLEPHSVRVTQTIG